MKRVVKEVLLIVEVERGTENESKGGINVKARREDVT